MTFDVASAAARVRVDEAIAAQEHGDSAGATRLYREAIGLDPHYPAPHFNLGLMGLEQGDLQGAENELRAALRLRPEFPEAWVALAEALEATGREMEALAALGTAIGQRENFAGALLNASVLLGKLGRPGESAARLSAFADAQADGALALQAQGRRGEAVELLMHSLSAAPAHARLRRTLAIALHGVTFNAPGEKERALVASLCADESISNSFLAAAVCGLLKGDPAFPALLKATREDSDPFDLAEPEARAFMCSPLLLAALPATTFMDFEVEEVLTSLRKAVLARSLHLLPDAVPRVALEFICALARQCFYSEYAFFETEVERNQIERLRTDLRESVTTPGSLRGHEFQLAIAGLYDPLSTFAESVRIADAPPEGWSEPFKQVIDEQLFNRRREKALEAAIPSLTPINDAVSVAVRSQYEENPYPVWASLQHQEEDSYEALSGRLRPGRVVRAPDGPTRILIAGCGTGHHPLQVAGAFPGAAILAVDLSRASLAYALRMAERFAIGNVRFAQADLLRLDMLTDRFSIVESAGVLHHLEDPMRGWRVLVNLMEDDGLMRIALYSQSARAGLRAARAFLQPLGYPQTADGIRRSRRAIAGLPADHPGRDALTFGDFFTLNGCRDLLMHVKEHEFTLPHIAESLAGLGLTFVRMECEAHASERFQEMFPDPGAQTDLDAWHRFESAYPQSFKSMYQFWCAKKE